MSAPSTAASKESLTAALEDGAPDRGAAIDTPPRVLALDARVLVTPSGATYLILHAGPAQLGDVVAWDVLYQPGDREQLSREGGEAGRTSAAHELFEAFRPFAEATHLGHLSITAMLGELGANGAIEQRRYTREEGRWRADGVARRTAIGQVPGVVAWGARDLEEEDRAREAAAQFISDADRADYDAAWSRTSALAKAVMSRSEFERRLGSLPQVDAAASPPLYLAFSPSAERFLPGSFVETWFVRDTADGVLIGALAMRLDDDSEWRVAAVLELTGPPGASVNGAPSQRATDI